MAKKIDQDKLKTVLNALDPTNDDHWNQAGGPDMNHVKEAMGRVINRKHITEAGYGEMTRDNCADFQAADEVAGNEPDEHGPEAPTEEKVELPPAPVSDRETGEPMISNERAFQIMQNPGSASAAEAGAVLIKGLDMLAGVLTGEVRRHQSELGAVFQLYQADRPSILGRQKRLAIRENRG